MTTFPVHSSETAPDGSKPILTEVQKSMGFVPNLIRVMAEAPVAAEAYLSLMDIFERSSLSDTEQQTVLLSASFVNGCDYCMAAHTMLAKMKRVPGEIVEALRIGAPLGDPRLDALATLTRSIVETRGWPDEAATEAFFKAGFGTSEYLEVVVGVTVKTLSNYVNHAAGTPLDAAFQTAKWAA
ncbi:MAG: carboxymuconolactone decarboxylase family protein [Alphaproteobacteria bacterium]